MHFFATEWVVSKWDSVKYDREEQYFSYRREEARSFFLEITTPQCTVVLLRYCYKYQEFIQIAMSLKTLASPQKGLYYWWEYFLKESEESKTEITVSSAHPYHSPYSNGGENIHPILTNSISSQYSCKMPICKKWT